VVLVKYDAARRDSVNRLPKVTRRRRPSVYRCPDVSHAVDSRHPWRSSFIAALVGLSMRVGGSPWRHRISRVEPSLILARPLPKPNACPRRTIASPVAPAFGTSADAFYVSSRAISGRRVLLAGRRCREVRVVSIRPVMTRNSSVAPLSRQAAR
jgi:hypothetical protein